MGTASLTAAKVETSNCECLSNVKRISLESKEILVLAGESHLISLFHVVLESEFEALVGEPNAERFPFRELSVNPLFDSNFVFFQEADRHLFLAHSGLR